MTTKLITSLDELKPGMKTKDGKRFIGPADGLCVLGYAIEIPNHGRFTINKQQLGVHFLNQEVGVPE